MYLLYLDDSGSVENAADNHIILAGLAVFERQPHWFSSRLEALAERVFPGNGPDVEFRGVDILSGRKHWRNVNREDRQSIYKEALGIVGVSSMANVFAAAVHKAAISPDDPMEFAFEQNCNRFDRFLGRLHQSGNTQRGMIVLDETTYETSLQRLARDFRKQGHRWGQLYNLADVPFFVDSRATRMIQFADLLAHAVRRYYDKGDSTYFDIFSHRFDAVGGVLHGLVHYRPPNSACNCFSCRRH